jgi:hypothetical protein
MSSTEIASQKKKGNPEAAAEKARLKAAAAAEKTRLKEQAAAEKARIKAAAVAERDRVKQQAAAEKAARPARLLAALREIQTADSWPLTVGRLAEHCGLPAAEALTLLNRKDLKSQVLRAKPKSADGFVVDASEAERLAGSDALLRFAAAEARRKNPTPPWSAAEFVKHAELDTKIKAAFQRAVEQRLKTGAMPGDLQDLFIPGPAELAQRLVKIVHSQRHASAESYPVAEHRLLELAGASGAAKEFASALKNAGFTANVTSCSTAAGARGAGAKTASKPCYVLKSDLEEPFPRLVAWALDLAIAHAASGKSSAEEKTTVFQAADLSAALLGKAKHAFATAIEQRVDQLELPPEVALLRVKGKPLFFRVADIERRGAGDGAKHPPKVSEHAGSHATRQPIENSAPPQPAAPVQPTAPAASASFAADFDAAFDRVNARRGYRNFIKLLELRQELPQVSRAAFDAGLRDLVAASRYTLDSSQGGTVQLTAEEREAGISDGSSLLIYVTRR